MDTRPVRRKWSPAEARRGVECIEQGLSYRQTAEVLNHEFNNHRTRRKVKDYWSKGYMKRTAVKEEPASPHDFETKPKKMRRLTHALDGSTTAEGNRPHTVEEMAELFNLNTDHWIAEKIITNNWSHFWQTKVWWKAVELNIVADNWHELLAQVTANAPAIPSSSKTLGDESILYEMCLFDAHLGSLAWGEETGEDYNLSIAVSRFQDAFRDLLSRGLDAMAVDKLLFIVGQDLFHFDTLIQGKGGATTKGTPQDVDTRWQKLFIETCEMLKHLIDDAAQLVPIDVLVVPGNHDAQTTFYAGEYLMANFTNNGRVRVDNTPRTRKYYRHGNVLIGFTHGDKEKIGTLYRLMTEEAGLANWREWHRGHRHQEECSEDGRMRVRTMPALAGRDSFHAEHGYQTLPGARGMLWCSEQGLLQQIYHNVTVLPVGGKTLESGV